jgi:dTDP-4-dehydrorhamnose reductase
MDAQHRQTALVFGASGLVGGACARRFARGGWRVVGTGVTRLSDGLVACDFRRPGEAARLVERVRPDVIVLSAAQPHVDRCEQETVENWRLNAEAPAEVAKAARETGAFVAFVSTDYVFPGRGPNREHDPIRPLNHYGRAKAASELALAALLPGRSACVRTTGCYGWERGGKNFILQLAGRLPRGERMRVVSDQVATPTHVDDLADALLAIATARATGPFHAVGADAMARLELARRACAAFGWDASLLDPVTTAELAQPAARPLDNPLVNERLAALMGRPLRGVDEGLRAMRAAMESDRVE